MLMLAFSAHAISTWTPYVSEEGSGTVSCNSGYAVRGLQCSGSYCDNMRLYCSNTGYPSMNTADYYWTEFASEEQGSVFCDYGYVMTGIECDGSYCDNVSLKCTAVRYSSYAANYSGGRVSDETSAQYSSTTYRIEGFSISGRYADNFYPYYVDYN